MKDTFYYPMYDKSLFKLNIQNIQQERVHRLANNQARGREIRGVQEEY